MTDFFLLAGEPSGDARGAQLIGELLKIDPSLRIAAVAGPKMREFPIECVEKMESLQVMGFVDVALALPRLASLFFKIRREVLERAPRAFVGIDYADFNLRMHASLKKKGFEGKRIHYVSPTVWAWRRRRIPQMAKTLDLLLAVLPFEPACFEGTGLRVEYVGHPLVEACREGREEKRENVLALFPGSRQGEVRRNLPWMVEAAKRLAAENPGMKVEVSVASAERGEEIRGKVPEGWQVVEPRESERLMRRARLALATSGTVTLELALRKTPTVVQFVIQPLDLFVARRVFKIDLPYYSLPNLVVGREVFPELFGPYLTRDALLGHARRLWSDEGERERCLEGCRAVERALGEGAASARAAELVMSLAGERERVVEN